LAAELVHGSQDRRCASTPVAPDADTGDFEGREFVEVVREQAEAWRRWVYEMRHPGRQAYAVLTMCRALYTHTHGEQATKRTAALWAQGYLP
jgi:hypothetical protein